MGFIKNLYHYAIFSDIRSYVKKKNLSLKAEIVVYSTWHEREVDLRPYIEDGITDADQLKVIGTFSGRIDVNKIANKDIPADKMQVLAEALNTEVDISDIDIEQYTADQIKSLLYGIKNDVYTGDLVEEGYSYEQVCEIVAGIKADIDFTEYLYLDWSPEAMRKKRLDLRVEEYKESMVY